MAAHSNNFIRVRLHFDYAPPAAVCSRMCWLLVDLNMCRVVSDLESLIRQKFELSRRSILCLFVEDCYLPHTESIYVVRDNDCVRKTEVENGFELKKKKRKKHKESPKKDGEQQALSEEEEKKKKKHKEKKKKKEPEETASAAPSAPALTAKKTPVEERSKSIKKPPVTQLRKQNVSSSESSSSSEEDVPPKKTLTLKPPTKTPAAPSKPPLTAKKTPVNVAEQSKSIKKPPVTQLRKQNVSSSESSSSSEEDVPPKKTPTPKPPAKTPDVSKKPPNSNPTAKKAPPLSSSSSDSDSSSNEAVSNKKTPINTPIRLLCLQTQTVRRKSTWSSAVLYSSWVVVVQVGCHRGKAEGGEKPGRGGVEEGPSEGVALSSATVETMVSHSAVILRPTYRWSFRWVSASAPSQPWSSHIIFITCVSFSMPLLAAPPQVGQNIAFMLLELTENYTPEVSEYKEAKIVSFDPTTKQIELELLTPVEPGKFDLVYQNPDGSERVEYAVARSSRVSHMNLLILVLSTC
uniref:Coilin p80 n=1 Tax=Sphaeramia orbicularis TaxID=375764 RepID=A0A672YWQ7_9TELE